jgi:lipoyl(octanoyl) transferase
MEYQAAWDLQRQIHRQRVAEERPDTVLLLEHPSTYTAGRRTAENERPIDGTLVVAVDRGGRITWHGPGQLVGYPILKLADPIDVVAYVRRIEQMLISVCREFGLRVETVAGRSGVWVSEPSGDLPTRKVAAIGIRIAQGTSLHGFALNCNPDMTFFEQIIPCGIDDAAATSLSAELGRRITVSDVLPVLTTHLGELYAVTRSGSPCTLPHSRLRVP